MQGIHLRSSSQFKSGSAWGRGQRPGQTFFRQITNRKYLCVVAGGKTSEQTLWAGKEVKGVGFAIVPSKNKMPLRGKNKWSQLSLYCP